MNRQELMTLRTELCRALYQPQHKPDRQILLDTNPACCGLLINAMHAVGFDYDYQYRTFVLLFPEVLRNSFNVELQILHDMVQGGHLHELGIMSFAGEVPESISKLFWKSEGKWAQRLLRHANPDETFEDQKAIATEFLYDYTKIVFPDSYLTFVTQYRLVHPDS